TATESASGATTGATTATAACWRTVRSEVVAGRSTGGTTGTEAATGTGWTGSARTLLAVARTAGTLLEAGAWALARATGTRCAGTGNGRSGTCHALVGRERVIAWARDAGAAHSLVGREGVVAGARCSGARDAARARSIP